MRNAMHRFRSARGLYATFAHRHVTTGGIRATRCGKRCIAAQASIRVQASQRVPCHRAKDHAHRFVSQVDTSGTANSYYHPRRSLRMLR
jgi:hypothetical protein